MYKRNLLHLHAAPCMPASIWLTASSSRAHFIDAPSTKMLARYRPRSYESPCTSRPFTVIDTTTLARAREFSMLILFKYLNSPVPRRRGGSGRRGTLARLCDARNHVLYTPWIANTLPGIRRYIRWTPRRTADAGVFPQASERLMPLNDSRRRRVCRHDARLVAVKRRLSPN